MNGPTPKTNREYLISIYNLMGQQSGRISACESCLKEHAVWHREHIAWRTRITGIWIGVTGVLSAIVLILGLALAGIKVWQ